MIQALCVDALNPAGRPIPANIRSYGFNGVRSVFFDQPDWYSYHRAAKQVGLKTIITLARESFGSRPHDEIIGNLPTDADYVVIGNEPDSPDQSSWTMSPSQFRTLIRECAPLISNRCPQAKIVAGGLVSGQPSWLEPIWRDLLMLVDYLDIHPYSKTSDEAQALLVEYYDRTSIPICVFEWNRPTDQITPFVEMLDSMTEAAAYFCWSDRMVDSFGLVDQLGVPKPQLTAIIDALAQPPEPPPGEYVLGFKEIADRHPDIVGLPRENESGPWRNCSTQFTSKGMLLWGNFADEDLPEGWTVKDQKGFIATDLTRYVWVVDHLEKQ